MLLRSTDKEDGAPLASEEPAVFTWPWRQGKHHGTRMATLMHEIHKTADDLRLRHGGAPGL
jgi:hypothetical protein